MGFLDFLSAAAPFAAEGVSNFREGQREGFEDRLAMADANLRRQREEEDRIQRRKLQAAQIRNYESLATNRTDAPSSPQARAQYDPARGGWVLPPDETNPQGQFVVPQGITPRPEAPRAPVRGTPEYLKAIREEAKARAQAEAQSRPSPDQMPQTQTDRARVEQQGRAFRNVKSALDRFEEGISRGITVVPGANKSALESAYEGLQLQMKELFNLGVLNGPDLELMRRIINNPSSLTLNAQRAIGVKPEDVIRAQIQQVRGMIEDYERNLSPQAPPPANRSSVIQHYNLERP